MSPFDTITNTYSSNLGSHYYPTQVIALALFCVAGDAIRQVRTGKSLNTNRLGKVALYGMLGGLVWALWFPLAEKWSHQLASGTLSILSISTSGKIMTILRTIYSIVMEQVIIRAVVQNTKFENINFFPGLRGDWRIVAKAIIYNIQLKWRVFALGVLQLVDPVVDEAKTRVN